MKFHQPPPQPNFSSARHGLDPQEVSTFLQLLSAYWQENSRAFAHHTTQLQQLREENQQITDFRNQWIRVLEVAQQTADTIVEQAQQEAADLLERARLQQQAIQTQRQQQNQRWIQAEQQHQQRLTRLQAAIRQVAQTALESLPSVESSGSTDAPTVTLSPNWSVQPDQHSG